MEDSLKDTEWWWWIDYLENEFDPTLDKDLELLLEHSAEDRDSFENFRLLKQWVKESDPASGVDSDQCLMRMRSHIMSAIDQILPIEKEAKSVCDASP
ncbi:MAG: hypothetical protein KF799_14220 [Bdellovibrionales bacterium]|nr:hypothetical protein [Bdellovibrionales bacterium]